jgi:aminopeptidase N
MSMVTVVTAQRRSASFKQRLCNRVSIPQSKVDPEALPKLPYTVLKYDLTLDWRKIFETHSPKYSGLQKITIRMTDAAPEISLDAIAITIDSIIIGASILSPTPQPDKYDKLNITLPASVRTKGSEFIMSIAYRKDTTDAGFYYASKGTADPYYSYTHNDPTLEDVAYTFGEPSEARNWMPCNDRPDNKAESEISIIVPNGIEAPSNGILVSKEAFTPTSTLWHWKSDKPIATYLMVADASNFKHWEGTHYCSAIPSDTVHLDYYAWQQDYDDTVTDGTHYNAQYFLSRNTSQIMTWLEERFGPFPFVKYGQVAVQPFGGGGMEHQSLTTIDRSWLKGDDEDIAHEMSHQWFGDKVTCDAFRDIWLNESFATFGETIWAEGSGGYDFQLKTLRSFASHYFCNQPIPMRSIINSDFNGPLTYSKGACVIHMLRRMVGDSTFFSALRGYLNTFAYSTATTEQFRDYMSSVLNIPLTDYINQWIMGAGHPDYDFSWTQGADTAYIRVNQLQKQRDHFIMPLHFFAYHNGIVDTLSFNNTARNERFKTMISYKIDSMGFDDDASMISIYRNANGDSNYHFDEGLTKLYGERAFSHTNRLLKNDPTLTVPKIIYTDFRVTVADDELTCTFEEQSVNTSITISNTAGMNLIKVPVSQGEQIKKIATHSFSSGIYFVRLGNETRKVAIIR